MEMHKRFTGKRYREGAFESIVDPTNEKYKTRSIVYFPVLRIREVVDKYKYIERMRGSPLSLFQKYKYRTHKGQHELV